MDLSFRKLSKHDFPLLLKWLEMPHVKEWWDSEVSWTLDKITQKYQSYVAQFKVEGGKKKSIFAYLIVLDEQAVGYIQYYDTRDFLTLPDGFFYPQKLAAIDLYIGEKTTLGRGVGSSALSQFIQDVVFNQFEAALVTPDVKNHRAIACYQKAGFTPCLKRVDLDELWLIAQKEPHAAS